LRLERIARLREVTKNIIAAADVALCKKVDALVPNIVEVELEPKVSLKPPPRPD